MNFGDDKIPTLLVLEISGAFSQPNMSLTSISKSHVMSDPNVREIDDNGSDLDFSIITECISFEGMSSSVSKCL